MKTTLFGVVLVLGLGMMIARADLEVSASVQIHAVADFEAPLTTHGGWVVTSGYGRCWRPAHVAVDWRPYCDGEWVWTDCGWYWESDEPWAWACYHYGSWVMDPVDGWVWVPDVEWAPAWVVWRNGGGYVGWAPCPPRRAGVSISISGPAVPFFFVDVNHFGGRIRPSTVIVNDRNLISRTTVVGSMRVESRSFDGGTHRVNFNAGPPLPDIQRATRNSVRTVTLHEAVARTPVPHIDARPVQEQPRETPRQPEPSRFDRGNDRAPGVAPVVPVRPNQPEERHELDRTPPVVPVVPPKPSLPEERRVPDHTPPGVPVVPVVPGRPVVPGHDNPPPSRHDIVPQPGHPPTQSPPQEQPREKDRDHGHG